MTSREEKKLQSRDRILRSAALLFRKKGIVATGVDSIMSKAGLTAGGFYSHFQSKEDLVAQALSSVLSQSKKRLLQATVATPSASPNRKMAAILEGYLSTSHRDQPETGCVLAALAGELPRQSAKTRNILAQHLESWIEELEELGLRRDQAIRSISMAVGSLILSRIVKGAPLSDEILKAATKSNS
jgi:TetR/AcrR family transcriptional repressor of nem operon